MSNKPTEILLEHIGWDYWGTVELMKKYPIINKFHWQYVCDPMDVDKDPDIANNITCIDDNGLDPWNRKFIPWKWRSFEDGKGWHMGIPHMFLSGNKKYPLAERYTTIEGKHLKLYKRVYDYPKN